ncbi:uncharacterized protein E0L32_010378 [Thyridium curvatum]|uniref:Uncharacterized protein n=1 Tax=Thyridium curvatum TaxID=1093900 RepID=A0A507AKG0_9PEZI|nr:uncharacterized protein E0L32_010378 [Thyridium curvatum]TPX07923.1 hypothetical protein E0L32_010378 [Thyridium curvatum]
MAFRDMYTQFYPPKPKFTERHVPSQKGRVFLVTGGTIGGVGFELCKMLFGTGATVYLTSRSKNRGEEAIKAITESSPAPATPGILKFIQLDLNDLASVKEAAAEFARQESKLDVLWNNAGTAPFQVQPSETTVQGHEAIMGRNCIAALLLTQLLLPQLRAAVAAQMTPGSVRVIWTASIAADHDSGLDPNGIDIDQLGTVHPSRTRNYALSKVGNWFLAREMARRYGSEGILSVVQNPGNTSTHGYDTAPPVLVFFMKALILQKPKLAGYTELFAGLSPDVKPEHGGMYIMPWGRIRRDEDCPRQDIIRGIKPEEQGGLGNARRFWEWCELQAKDYM